MQSLPEDTYVIAFSKPKTEFRIKQTFVIADSEMFYCERTRICYCKFGCLLSSFNFGAGVCDVPEGRLGSATIDAFVEYVCRSHCYCSFANIWQGYFRFSGRKSVT